MCRITSRVALIAICLAAVHLGVSSFAQGTFPVSASLVEDAYIVNTEADAVHYDHPARIETGVYARSHAAVTRAGFMQFAIPALSANATVTEATVTGYFRGLGTGDGPAVVTGVAASLDLTTLTWNSALSDNIITGSDGTDFRVLWGTEATVFSGEEWSDLGGTREMTVYTDTTPADGLLKFINDWRVPDTPLTVTIGLGGPAGDSDYQFALMSSETFDDNPVLPAGAYAQTLELTVLEVPEPASGMVAGLVGLVLWQRRRR